MRGRKPKPTVLKLLAGNPGKRAINRREPKPRDGLPSPPSYLGKVARAEWRRVLKEAPAGLVTRLDRQVLALYCQNVQRIAELEKLITDKGFTIVTDKGNEIQRPEVGILNTTQAHLKAQMAELGLTPASRSRVTMSDTPKTDPTEEKLFGKRGTA